MPKLGDYIEIVSTGKPRETKVIVDGNDIANQVSGVRIDLDPSITRITLVCIGLSPVVVSGYLVPEADMKAFQEWRAERVIADVARQPQRTHQVLKSMSGVSLRRAIAGFVASLKAI